MAFPGGRSCFARHEGRNPGRLAEAGTVPESQRDKDQWWYWTDEWQAGEQQITADRAAGRRGPVFASGDEFLAALREAGGQHDTADR